MGSGEEGRREERREKLKHLGEATLSAMCPVANQMNCNYVQRSDKRTRTEINANDIEFVRKPEEIGLEKYFFEGLSCLVGRRERTKEIKVMR
jgi:hypothetical protein